MNKLDEGISKVMAECCLKHKFGKFKINARAKWAPGFLITKR